MRGDIKKQVLVALIATIALAWFYLVSTTISTPNVSYLRWYIPNETAYMKDSPIPPAHEYVPLSRISPSLRSAVVISEDDQFYSHEGIDWEAIKKALKMDWKRKRLSHGASTISMQLARNLFLSSDKSIFRKLREILIALKIERELPKKRILEIYLNVVEWGNGIFGAEKAARHYFGTSAANLGTYEASFLAAILPRPRYYDKHRGSNYLKQRIANIQGRL